MQIPLIPLLITPTNYAFEEERVDKFVGSVELCAFPPRPADFHRRPAPLENAPPRTSLLA